MKVAILHDWLTGFRGGERVLEIFCEMYPDAKMYTLIHRPGSTTKLIEEREIVSSFLSKVPGIGDNYRKFLPLFPFAAEQLKIDSDTDLVISSSHCVIKGVKIPPGAKHISYVHSPMRYIYDQFNNYFQKGPKWQLLAAHILRPFLRTWDYITNPGVDVFIANSHFVKKRIELFYHRDAEVVHPFVDLKDFKDLQHIEPKKKDYYLMVTAFAPNKFVDLAIEAFNQLGKKLYIIGGGQQEKYLKSIAKENITFLGRVSREEIVTRMREAKGFVFPGVEDFGITPLEALAAGTPVIAYKIGGVLETLNDDVAQFFEQQTADCLAQAIEKFETKNFNSEILYKRADGFSRERFVREIEEIINKTLN